MSGYGAGDEGVAWAVARDSVGALDGSGDGNGVEALTRHCTGGDDGDWAVAGNHPGPGGGQG